MRQPGFCLFVRLPKLLHFAVQVRILSMVGRKLLLALAVLLRKEDKQVVNLRNAGRYGARRFGFQPLLCLTERTDRVLAEVKACDNRKDKQKRQENDH